MKKGILAREFAGFNLKEKAYVYGGMAAGALIPIVGGKYLLSAGMELDPLGEAISWGGSIVGNLLSFITFPYTPVVYTSAGGILLGMFCAESSQRKRKVKKNLDFHIEKISDYIKNPENEENLRQIVNDYRQDRERNTYWYPKLSKKYDNKFAKLTEKLNCVPIN